MSDFARSFDRRLTWAVLASLALHLWFAAAFPAGTAAEDRPAVLSLVHVARIHILRRTSTPRPRAAAPARVPASRALRRPAARAPRFARATIRATRPIPGIAPQAAVALPSVAPTIVPPTPAPISTHVHAAGGYMPFGAQENDPVLDPRVLQALRGLGVHATLTILVGEDGKTKSVAFSPPLDPQVEAAIESALADANWDPAYCGGGIPCAKPAVIKI